MTKIQKLRMFLLSDTGLLILVGVASLMLHTLLNGRYGFHRDELNTLENARHLAWGYVEYPPFTPFLVRLAYALFGPAPVGLRFISAAAMSITLVLAGLMARDLGGGRKAQILAALSTTIAPYVLLYGGIGMYETYDYFWWVVVTFLIVRLLKTDNPRWWLGIGAAIGLGMMSKYSMGFLVAGIVVGIVLTKARRFLLSPWLWAGVGISLLIFLPNLIWQVQHDFISLDFLQSIHARDVRIGRGEDFLSEQFWACTNLVTVPLWIAGLFFILLAPAAKAFRMVVWMCLVPFGIFYYLQGRSYYLTGVYPVLLAAGSVAWEAGLNHLPHTLRRVLAGVTYGVVIVSGAAFSLIALPLAPVGSDLFVKVSGINTEFREQVGWPELVKTVAEIYAKIPEEEKAVTGILAGNYGEAGAVNLYGPEYGLPKVISGVNTYWLRGYGDPPPQTLIVLGIEDVKIYSFFKECGIEGRISNPYNIPNEEYLDHSRIYVCRGLRKPWAEIWQFFQNYG
jgi:4-amino-4-deoxy-L-arabinose transferase-like glycosyltransferase